jgi:predicted amidohydrolase
MKNNSYSRRDFFQKSIMLAGAASASPLTKGNSMPAPLQTDRILPREVWLASFSQEGMVAETPEAMTRKVLEKLEVLELYHPDFLCLPEVFAFTNVENKYSLNDWPVISDEILEQFAVYAQKNKCYVICPVYTKDERQKVYNSAVVIDRQGQPVGTYRKIHVTEGEVEKGVTPGPLSQPVIQTDFGIIGIQICFDIQWDDGWSSCREQGAEIIFYPSAFPGGQMVNTRAWQHKCVVVSSTNKDTSKICDITGEEVDRTGIWKSNVCWGPVNLEKAFLHLWPYVRRFPEIHRKYGRKIRITLYHDEEWAIIESLSREVKVKDVLLEFDLKTLEQHIRDATTAQQRARQHE